MTSIQGVLAAFAIIFIDLIGRAGLDKVLAIAGGPDMVALWAQLQSAVEVVGSVALVGVLQGLTVLTAQVNHADHEFSLLRSALRLGLGTSLGMFIVVLMAAPEIAGWISNGRIEKEMLFLAAFAGFFSVIPATLNAYWLGKHQQHRMLWLSLASGGVLLLLAVGAWMGLALQGLIEVQSFVMACFGILVWFYLQKMTRVSGNRAADEQYFSELIKFVPVGLVIGILSPVSMLLVRTLLAQSLSWGDVGFFQALMRSTEWVTSICAGVFSLVFLPRFSAAHGSVRFHHELIRAGFMVLIPSACVLLVLFFNQHILLSALYNPDFVVSDQAAGLVMLGCWIRIASWLFLFGFFSAKNTGLVMIGEILSLPLFAALLWYFAEGMTLERTALLYASSYLVYLGFNFISMLYVLRKNDWNGATLRIG